MGGSSGGSGTQTTVSKSDPWSGQQPYLTDIFSQAKKAYQSGTGSQYYPGQTVTPFSSDTKTGMDLIRAEATKTPDGLPEAEAATKAAMTGEQMNRNDVLQSAASGGKNNPLLAMLTAMSLGMTNPVAGDVAAAGATPTNQRGIAEILASGQATTPNVQAMLASGSRDVTAGGDTLQKTASGEMLGGNPLLDAMYERAAAKVRDNTNAAFSAGGRYGSGAHGSVLGETLGGLATDMYGGAYEAERNRMMAAASELGAREAADIDRETSAQGAAAQFGANDLSRRLSAGSSVAGYDQADANRNLSAQSLLAQLADSGQARQLSAANSAANVADSDANRQVDAANAINAQGLNTTAQGLSAAGLLPMLRELGMAGGQDLLGLGAMQEGKSDEAIQDALNRWNFEQQAPWDQLARYSGIVGGMGNLGGTTTSTAPKAQSGGLMGALSGGAAGAGISSLLGLTGPLGWGVAGLGGLAGLFS